MKNLLKKPEIPSSSVRVKNVGPYGQITSVFI